MQKTITITEEQEKRLNFLADIENRNLKNYLEMVIIKHIKSNK
jgi:hypothetical protein